MTGWTDWSIHFRHEQVNHMPRFLLLHVFFFHPFLLLTANNYHMSNIFPDILGLVSTNIHHLLRLSSVRRHQHYLSIWNLFPSTHGENLAKGKNKFLGFTGLFCRRLLQQKSEHQVLSSCFSVFASCCKLFRLQNVFSLSNLCFI